jgi:hypothetical protein
MGGTNLMTTNGGPRSGDSWQRAVAALVTLSSLLAELRSDYAAFRARLEGALQNAEQEVHALFLLGVLETDYTAGLVDCLVATALTHGKALFARQLLGRLPYAQAAELVPPAVWRQLDATGDDDAYRRLAELLQHLGLRDALRELCERAMASPDPDTREVGEDFMPSP